MLFAHSLPNRPRDDWQELADHLLSVANLASTFASPFGAGEWGRAAGLLHDVGKCNPIFQRYLLDTAGQPSGRKSGVDHSSLGAQIASNLAPGSGRLLAYALAGHHGGLPNGNHGDPNRKSDLVGRLKKDVHRCLPAELGLEVELPDKPPLELQNGRVGFQLAFFVRMLFSCLVDADFLDTEGFMAPDKGAWRGGYTSLTELEARFFARYTEKYGGEPEGGVNLLRRQVFEQCLAKADLPPGFFSLTVPTGGGKTLSSMAFALRHALAHNKDRVIYVIPYMSIIEQNAAVFRDFLGEQDVLEHHSSFDFRLDSEDEKESAAAKRAKLASENWDAPVVATTAVQFFESLFAARPSRCRKLHNVAKSVIVLDEAQMMPRELLLPCLEALRELVLNYGCTVVLCTATQPAITLREDFRHGLDGVREIMDAPQELYAALRRVAVENIGQIDDEALAARLAEHEQALCIVNTKKHARRLYQRLNAMGAPGLHHLSTNMYAAHRSRKIEEIKTALKDRQPCVVVSTSLVEAGVDLDFPVVYRAASGIDSIAQAAGRCDREGRLTAASGSPAGRVYVFWPTDKKDLPSGHFTVTANEAAAVLRNHDDPLSLAAVEHYFRLLFWQMGDDALDKHGILSLLNIGDLKYLKGPDDFSFPFRDIAVLFKLIKDDQQPILVGTEDEAGSLVRELETNPFPGNVLRKLQRYTVQVRQDVFKAMEEAGDLRLIADEYWLLDNSYVYADDVGLDADKIGQREPTTLLA